jgi:hypothetical protein
MHAEIIMSSICALAIIRFWRTAFTLFVTAAVVLIILGLIEVVGAIAH